MTYAPSAAELIGQLALAPHPEGGHFRETYRDAPADGGRGAVTHIYYLLQLGEVSAWHRVVDAVEIWHFYAGDPLVLTISNDGIDARSDHLGGDLNSGQSPEIVVPAGAWQTAETLGRWTLVGCTVSPAFEFSSFEMAPADWRPGRPLG